jgi:uncharacterized protein YuzE
MRMTYDPEADAAYIYVVDKIAPGEAKITRTMDNKKINGTIAIDFNEDGKLLGIEIIPGANLLSKKVLAKAELLLPRKKRGASR